MARVKDAVIDDLVFALEKALTCLTGEDKPMWMESQAFDEAPYHFIWKTLKRCREALDSCADYD